MSPTTLPTIFIAGHNGMVGSAIVRELQRLGNANIITAFHSELDLTNQQAVTDFFAQHNIDQVYLAAAKVGGIHANNTYPADFIYTNLMIEANVIHAAHANNVQQLLFLGSSCIYPRMAAQPISEEALLTGALEPTNAPYALAKIAGIKLCESYNRQYGRDYRSVMPTNLYGPGDNYHPTDSHVIPALIRRFYEACSQNTPDVSVWGTGKPRRDFLHVDDLARACVHVMHLSRRDWQAITQPDCSHLNVGSGKECTIAELARKIADITGFNGRIHFDTTQPDGTPRKQLDSRKLRQLGWQPNINLQTGLQQAYHDFLERFAHG